jgi:hypothetical protein
VKSVVVTRMVTNPTGGPTPPAEAVLTIGWGGVARLDLEPASCGDPECDADHGYTGTFAADDFSIRVSTAADGSDEFWRLIPPRVTGEERGIVVTAHGIEGQGRGGGAAVSR